MALLVCPISFLAPLGAWIPLALGGITIIFFSKKFYQNIDHNKFFLSLLFFFLWALISTCISAKSADQIIKLTEMAIVIFFGFLLCRASLYKNDFKSFTYLMGITFLSTAMIMLIDIYFALGMKIWLAKNLDFNNFKNFYTLKEWISYRSFRNESFHIIQSYLGNS